MDKLIDKNAGGGAESVRPARSSRSTELSPAGAKIVSAFQEAIDVMRSGEPLPGG